MSLCLPGSNKVQQTYENKHDGKKRKEELEGWSLEKYKYVRLHSHQPQFFTLHLQQTHQQQNHTRHTIADTYNTKPNHNKMKFQSFLPFLTALSVPLSLVEATQVNWYGCSNEFQRTDTTGTGCTNISGWKQTNLCGVWVPPPDNDRCEFYTTACGIPWGTTYHCSVSSGRCDAGPWKAISSYRCWP